MSWNCRRFLQHVKWRCLSSINKKTLVQVDFLVDEKICVEIKALTQLENAHLAQAINYLEAFNLEVGLLINFGNTRLEFHRLQNKKYKSSAL
jgi:GxxExxY protein